MRCHTSQLPMGSLRDAAQVPLSNASVLMRCGVTWHADCLKSGVCLCLSPPIQLWQAALNTLNPNPTDSCPLYLNYATVAALPSRVSRHNSPSAAHFVTRLVRTCLPPGTHRCIVVSASERPGLRPAGSLPPSSAPGCGDWPPVAQMLP